MKAFIRLTVLAVAAVPAFADSIIDIPTNNTFVGLYNPGGGPTVNYDYFTVDLTNFTDTVTSVKLRLARGHIGSSFGIPPSSFPPSIFNLVIYGTSFQGNGTGSVRPSGTTTYGTVDLLDPGAADPSSSGFIMLELNSAAIADLNAARGGLFSFYGELLGIPDLGTGVQEWFAFDGAIGEGGSGPIAQLMASSTPEISSIFLLGTLLAAFAARRFIPVRNWL